MRASKAPELCIHLVRHGESEWQTGADQSHDSRLSERGWRQAERTAERVGAELRSGVPVFASPLKRSLETVTCLRRPYTVLEPLREAAFDLKACLPRFDGPGAHRPDAAPQAQYLGFREEVASLLADLVDKGATGSGELYAYTHGGVIKTLLRAVHGTDAVCYRIDNCSLTTLAWYHGRWHVERMNDAAHLPRELRS